MNRELSIDELDVVNGGTWMDTLFKGLNGELSRSMPITMGSGSGSGSGDGLGSGMGSGSGSPTCPGCHGPA
jgi:hypothetical protein